MPPRSAPTEPPLQAAYRRLFRHYGPQGWWPGRTRFEVMAGAILVQHTNWRNASRAIASLRGARRLTPRAIDRTAEDDLTRLVRVAGTASVKARRLKALARFVCDEFGGSTTRLFADVASPGAAAVLRRRLLAVHGVGPETADAILLYAGNAPAFVVDAYARRVLGRHGWGDPEARYSEVQNLFTSQLPADAQLFNEYHALLVRVGVEHCRKPQPRCEGCPLEPLLPAGGAVLEA